MKTTLCVIGTVLAFAVAVPVSAQDRVMTDNGVWAPWASDQTSTPTTQVSTIAPAPQVNRPVAVARVVAQAQTSDEAEVAAPRLIRLDRFWVVGSFR